MPLILSTKILTQTQKRHLFLAKLSLVEYNGVILRKLPLDLNGLIIKHAIFTSQNAVKYVFENSVDIKHAYCVGEKTAALLDQNGIPVLEKAKNAKELAELLIKNHPEEKFSFFCSKQRRCELPDLLKAEQIDLEEYHVYESICNFKTFDNQFDAVLCFSPIGAESFYTANKVKPLAICIGETTAKAARQYTDDVIVSNRTSVDSVILKAIKTLSK